jgi:hypothetical protein
MPEPRPEDIATADTMVLALRSTFRPEAAGDLRAGYELRFGELVVHARVDHGELEVDEGPLPDADLVLAPGESFHPLLTGSLDPGEAIESGRVRIEGSRAPDRFVEVFHIPPLPCLFRLSRPGSNGRRDTSPRDVSRTRLRFESVSWTRPEPSIRAAKSLQIVMAKRPRPVPGYVS